MSSTWFMHLHSAHRVPPRDVNDHPVSGYGHVDVRSEILDEKRSPWPYSCKSRPVGVLVGVGFTASLPSMRWVRLGVRWFWSDGETGVRGGRLRGLTDALGASHGGYRACLCSTGLPSFCGSDSHLTSVVRGFGRSFKYRRPMWSTSGISRSARVWCARRTGERQGVQVPRDEGVTTTSLRERASGRREG